MELEGELVSQGGLSDVLGESFKEVLLGLPDDGIELLVASDGAGGLFKGGFSDPGGLNVLETRIGEFLIPLGEKLSKSGMSGWLRH